jgi:hypothetical protein
MIRVTVVSAQGWSQARLPRTQGGVYMRPTTKSLFIQLTNRAFYTCPLNRDDPNRCKFFKWEDELDSTTPQKPKPIQAAGRTIGQSPQTLRTPVKANTAPKAAEPVIDEIDWDKVDTDELENQAILSTPGSSQQASQGQTPGSTSFQDRLRAAVDDGVNKRKREDEEQTPKRAKVDTDVGPLTPRVGVVAE